MRETDSPAAEQAERQDVVARNLRLVRLISTIGSVGGLALVALVIMTGPPAGAPPAVGPVLTWGGLICGAAYLAILFVAAFRPMILQITLGSVGMIALVVGFVIATLGVGVGGALVVPGFVLMVALFTIRRGLDDPHI